MGDMFRSEKMALCQMFLQPEAAYATLAELGEKGCIQFRDLNDDVHAFQRKYVSEVRRCDEMERQIRFIEKELKKDEIEMPAEFEGEMPASPQPREVIDLEAQLESIESEIRELAQNNIKLNENYVGLTELKQILENADEFFASDEMSAINAQVLNDTEPIVTQDRQQQRGELGFVAGIMRIERFFAFERMLWRMSHGNVFVKRCDLCEESKDLETGTNTRKTVFVIFFQGEELKLRIKKICTGFHARMYPCPSTQSERLTMIKDVNTRLEDLKMVLNQTADHRNRALHVAAKQLPEWSIKITKMKAIYHTLNLCNMDLSNKCLVGEGWVPKRDIAQVRDALAHGSAAVGSTMQSFMNIVDTHEQPPTYTRTNKFTSGFQNLIDAYGVASYREVNPALYSCITFPFLFGVMFGDVGHGILLLLCGLFLVIREKQLSKIKEEIFRIFFGGRYIITLMGLFSIYAGFIYNDVFSKSMNIFGSAWRARYNTTTVLENEFLIMDPKYHVDGVYTLGVDPIWQLDDNKIIFFNSFKMKLSIVLGVVHMMFGVIMSLVNFAYFKKPMDIILQFVPQLLFLVLLFGYMVFMMFFKWAKYTAKSDDLALTPGCAPSILIIFINMMLFGSTEPPEGCKEFLFDGQKTMQIGFTVVALLCIPWMLLGKPLLIMYKRKQQAKLAANALIAQDFNGHVEHADETNETQTAATTTAATTQSAPAAHNDDDEHANEPMSEVFIQQAIHTIEYVLSTVSHTASYLRLWALSLAHSQLSEIVWTKILHMGFFLPIGYLNAPIIYILFPAWAGLTFGILVVIEGLSAFLHTLRLHWVEFMSKFYMGLGYPFAPFSFKTILEEKNDEYA